MGSDSRPRLMWAALLFALYSSALLATTVRDVGLMEMVNSADRIFVGTCVRVESRRDERGAPATYVTFQVTEAIKGQFGSTITIKQIGGGSQSLLRIPDMPSYTVGEEVVLFLHPDSSQGFTSPVGLHQGKWSVLGNGDANRNKLVRSSLRGGLAGVGTQGVAPYGQRGKRSVGQTFPYDSVIPQLKQLAAGQ